MGDYFLQLLPSGHAIRTMTIVAARASLGNEPTLGEPVGATVDVARQQMRGDILGSGCQFSTAVIALPAASRIFLLELFGLPVAPSSKAAQAARIDAHRTAHHPALAAPPQAGGNVNVGAGAQGGAGAGAHGGAGAGANPGDDTGGFAPALLPANQVEAQLAVPRLVHAHLN
jgi:hypothetical protein